MIILELNEDELNLFKEQTINSKLNFEVIQSKKLGGDEIIFQLILTTISVASPYIIDFFKSQKKESKIVLIKDGVKYIFEKEDDLKKFLELNK